jgi:hypothetical protein
MKTIIGALSCFFSCNSAYCFKVDEFLVGHLAHTPFGLQKVFIIIMTKEELIKALSERKYPFDKTDCPLKRELKKLAKADYIKKLTPMSEEQLKTLYLSNP